MRSRNSLPALLVGLMAGLFAMSTGATPLCLDDERGGRAESKEEQGDESETLAEGPVEELILPCAMVDSDQLGPWCLDAAVYLVTTSGTLLCRVSLPAVDIAFTSSPDLEERDPAPMPQRAPLLAPAASLASAHKDAARPLVLERAPLPDQIRLPPSPVYAEPPFVPG